MDLKQPIDVGVKVVGVVPPVGVEHDHLMLVGAEVDGLEAVLEECGFAVVVDFPTGEEEWLSRVVVEEEVTVGGEATSGPTNGARDGRESPRSPTSSAPHVLPPLLPPLLLPPSSKSHPHGFSTPP